MNGFWKIVSEDIENVRIKQAEKFSPYSEFTERWIDESLSGKSVMVNGFYRFDSIMQALFAEDGVEKEIKEWLFDIYMHYLVQIEFRAGMSHQEIEIRQKWNELSSGVYGEINADIFKSFDSEKRYYLAHTLWRQSKTNASINKFAEAMVYMLGRGIVYKDMYNEKQILLYVNAKENAHDLEVIELVKDLFLPLGYELNIFWDKHFAVIGQEQTMQLDEIKLL